MRVKSCNLIGGLAVAISLAAPSAAVPASNSPSLPKVDRGKIAIPAPLTPGQVERVSLSGLPPRTKFRLSATVPLANCPSSNCQFTPMSRQGGRAFRTSSKGRAVASFIMARGYQDFSDDTQSDKPRFVSFVDGQTVQLHVDAARAGVSGFANAFGVIEQLLPLPQRVTRDCGFGRTRANWQPQREFFATAAHVAHWHLVRSDL